MEVIVGADGTDTPPPSVIVHPFPPLSVEVVKYVRAVPATEIVYLLKPALNTTLFLRFELFPNEFRSAL